MPTEDGIANLRIRTGIASTVKLLGELVKEEIQREKVNFGNGLAGKYTQTFAWSPLNREKYLQNSTNAVFGRFG